MTDSDQIRFIRQEIEKQLNIILSGRTQSSAKFTEGIANMYPGMDVITERPIMRPYGIISLAPDQTTQVTGRMGTHIANRLVLGHRDQNAPEPGAVGETIVYSMGGYEVKVANGQISLGKGGEFETMVVGDTLKEFLILLLNHIIAHTHIGNLGAPTSPPQNASDFTSAKADFVDNDKILAKDGGRF